MNTTGPADNKGPVETRTSRAGRALKAPKAYAPVPTASTTGKRPTRKKAIVCVKCHRGHSPNTNMIVFCDGCDATWHQLCHDPPIDDQVVLEKDTAWLCRSCSPVRRSTPARPAKVKKAKRIHPRLQKGPRLEVPGGELPVDERRAYLSRLSHAELVELAVKVSENNPQVPMFPTNMAGLPTSQFVATQTSPDPSAAKSKKRKLEQTETSRATKRSRTTAGTSKGKAPRARSAPASATVSAPGLPSKRDLAYRQALLRYSTAYDVPFRGNPLKEPSTVDGSEAPSVTDRETSPALSEPRDISPPAEFSEQELPEVESSSDAFEPAIDPRYEHRVYPKSGHGFTISSNPADLDILRERADYETFSHSLHGPAKDPESFQAAQNAAAATKESVPPKSSKSRSSKSAPPKPQSGSSKPGSSKSTSYNPAPPPNPVLPNPPPLTLHFPILLSNLLLLNLVL
ncbi:uncharacterized protein N7483_001931 [Penicillium malachiteum]|uniref:uncharacterized protein n=1 Tax=Penicillium malachiteum TaxID=1324776 RepID=UPI002546845D|nr:uncharacterized protein N7483_001931 [Penicillium malachiteum]KAJ5736806.1 hypothetical protein N7483_001931 [Penicillium malachiteum]